MVVVGGGGGVESKFSVQLRPKLNKTFKADRYIIRYLVQRLGIIAKICRRLKIVLRSNK